MPAKVLSQPDRFNVYEAITTIIIETLEAGAGDFVLPWHRRGLERPANALTGTAYQGVNVVGLWAASVSRGFGSSYWATYRQWTELKAQVRRGEKASVVLFYKPHSKDDESGPDETGLKRRFIARASWVFNADQVADWSDPASDRPNRVEPVEAAECVVGASGADVRHGGSQAYYSPVEDRVHLPERDQFIGSDTRSATEAYYAILLHELVHWTGAAHRLDRTFGARFGDEAYAFEELVAELGAAFLCADLGLTNEPRGDHAAYVGGWLKVLRQDNRAIVTASRLAGQAAAYLQSR